MGKQRIHVPDEMAVLLLYAVGEAVDLFCFDLTGLPPAHNGAGPEDAPMSIAR